MKLRQKSYLLTILLAALALYGSALIMLLQNVRASVAAVESRVLGGEKALALAVDGLFENMPPENRSIYVRGFAAYDSGGASYAIGSEDEIWVSTTPEPPKTDPGRIRWIRQNGRVAVAVQDTLPGGIWVRYSLDATDAIRRIERQAIGSALICAVLSGGFAIALYLILGRVNRPVERLAHELRTPLTVIRGYGELLERAKLTPEQQHQAASYIVTESERLGEISQKLLTLADARKNVFRPERLKLSEIAAHLQRTYPTLKTELEWDTLTADRALILSMLGNLIGNAVKASRPGDPVLMKAAPGTIEIIDKGAGMNEEKLKYVNDPSHAKNPSIRSGLGVPLCHEIAALHGATLRFASKEGEGTTATVRFGTSKD